MIDEFLKKYDLNRYTVSKISGISESLLSDANKRSLNSLTVKILNALAMATGKTSGEVLDEISAQQGNPIIAFIEAHPWLDKDLVNEVEDIMIEVHEMGINLSNVTFNRYYEGEDTNERANVAIENLCEQLVTLEEQKMDDDAIDLSNYLIEI
ncbi:hypothetical protein [Lentilactobacillus sp. SPB1-3]|uniref:Uncharacterized protein n=1 Tax=Lentilactobacillus terminaliae TaxID=3003483 RepID=A0ACD5DCT9_9LACO|nr:hypothetical protein [Lentilactobacillus sp. SPB1-3]MCZ0978116.1 hypothetical protein [Lentilactobacillus sp. SPB1-3]